MNAGAVDVGQQVAAPPRRREKEPPIQKLFTLSTILFFPYSKSDFKFQRKALNKPRFNF